MFSNLIKFVFILTGYSPILLIYWVVGVYNSKCYLTNIFIVPTFLGLILLCWYILKLAKTKLTVNEIQLKSLKPADNNFMPFILSYFLPCVELHKKDFIFICIWLFLLFLVVLINKNSNHYNPILKFLNVTSWLNLFLPSLCLTPNQAYHLLFPFHNRLYIVAVQLDPLFFVSFHDKN